MEIQRLKRRLPLSADIAKQLHDSIVSGAFSPGDQLPGQRELATSFGASMASIREAISVLTAIGLLDVRPGKGTTVVGMTESDSPFHGWLGLADSPDAISDLLEVRRLLETFVVTKAANAAAHEVASAQRSRLQELASAMRDTVDDPDAYLEADLAFHEYLAELSGNRVLWRMMKIIRSPLKWQLQNSNREHLQRHGNLLMSFEAHARLAQAISEGDSEEAVARVDEMVDRAYAFLVTDRKGGE